MTKQQIINILQSEGFVPRTYWTKSKLINYTEKQLSVIFRIIEHHQHHSNSYFWTPPGSANERRREETRKSFTVNIGNHQFTSIVDCSCKNYYYTGTTYTNGKKTTIREIKKLQTKLLEILPCDKNLF